MDQKTISEIRKELLGHDSKRDFEGFAETMEAVTVEAFIDKKDKDGKQ